MIARRLTPVAVALVAGLALAAPAHADRTAEIGIEDGQVMLAPRGDSPAIVAQWRAMGVDWVRIQAYWDASSPNARSRRRPRGFNPANHADPRYKWAALDSAVNLALANGLRVMLTIHQFGPVWASTQPSRGRIGWKPNPRIFAQWAGAVARRYGSRVSRYLVGNEPNQGVFLSPQTECRRGRCERTAANVYRDLVNAAYPAIKRSDPGAQVIVGELAPIGAIGKRAGNLAPLAFIRAMHCRDDRYRRIRTGACRRYRRPRGDGFGYHPYQIRERPNQPNRNPNVAKLGDLRRLFRALDRSAGRRYNLYITEYGYETNPPDRRFGVSLTIQSKFLQQSSYIVWATRRVKLVTQYLWRDDPRAAAGGVQGFQTGLRFANDVAKPSLGTFQHPIFIDQRRGRTPTLWGQVRPGGAHQVRVFRQVGGGAFVPFLTLNTDRRGYFSRRGALAGNSNYFFEYTLGGRVVRSDFAHAR